MKAIVNAIGTIHSKGDSTRKETNHPDGVSGTIVNGNNNNNNNNRSARNKPLEIDNSSSIDTKKTSSSSPSSLPHPSSKSQKSGGGLHLRNSKAQLLRLDALYDQEEDENDEHENNVSQSLSSASSSFLKPEEEEEEDDDNYNDSGEDHDHSFLEDARASLRDLDEWGLMMSTAGVGCNSSSCDASFNSSYLEGEKGEDHDAVAAANITSKSICFNTISSGWSLATPVTHHDVDSTNKNAQIPSHPSSTLLWMNEIKEADLEQRRRIAEAIAATSDGSTHRLGVQMSNPRSPSKKSMKRFQNKENLKNDDHGSHSSIDKGAKNEGKLVGGQQRRFSGSFFRSSSRRGSFSRNKEPERDVEETRLDDNNDARTDSTRSFVNHYYSPTRSGSSSCGNSPSRTTENRQPPAIGVESRINDKELQLKRAHLGSVRVVTMDGIVESFASVPVKSGSPLDAIVEVVGRRERTNIRDAKPGEFDSSQVNSGTPLTWV